MPKDKCCIGLPYKTGLLRKTLYNIQKPFSNTFTVLKQTCVKECPQEAISFWFLLQTNFAGPISEIVARQKIKPFCDKKLYSDDKSLEEMMKDQICPEWIVTSQPFLGRCVPFLPKNASSSGDIFEEDWVSLVNNQVYVFKKFPVIHFSF